ncbi:MAG: hypothetical protein ACLFSQ_13265 [Candidatus Zixiibacteriota bacterium]
MKILLLILGIVLFLFLVLIILLLQNIVFTLKCKKSRFSWKIKYIFITFGSEGLSYFGRKAKKPKKAKSKKKKDKRAKKETEKEKKELEAKKKKKGKKSDKEEKLTLEQFIMIIQNRALAFDVIGKLFRFIVDFITDFRVRLRDIEIWLGMGEPASTGMALGWIYSLGFAQSVYPNYFEQQFDYSGELIVKYRPFMFFWRLLQFIWRLPKIRLFKFYKSLKGGKDG